MELDNGLGYDAINQVNLLRNSDWTDVTDATPVGGAESITGGYYQVTGDGSAADIGAYSSSAGTCVTGHKVYVRANVRVRDANCDKISLLVNGSTGGSTEADSQATPATD